jgi:hypothetical protein
MVSVFISYAHADEKLKDRFLVHLGALKRERLIGVWHDRMLRPGEHLDRAIEAELAAADLVVLLVSPDFINSDYCTEMEMRRAFARAKDGRCMVVPVILRPSLWRDIPIDDEGGRLGDFVALPHDGKPVTQSRHGRESALDSVVAGIRRLIKDKSAPGPVVQSTGVSAVTTGRAGVGQPTDAVAARSQTRDTSSFERDVLLADAIVKVFRPILNQRISERLKRIREGDVKSVPLAPARKPPGEGIVSEFRQAALDGRLPIWAKRLVSDVWEAVPQEFWKDHYISFDDMAKRNPDPTTLFAGKKDERGKWLDSEWRKFMTSSSAVDALWPAKKR